MPSGSRSKEDTWKADDLGSALRGIKDDHRRSEDRKRSDKDVRDRRKTDKDDDRDRKERKHREHTDPDRKERTRDKDRDRDREKGRDRDRDRHDREKGGKEKERSERHRSKPENGDREMRRDDRKRSTVDKSGSQDKAIASQSNEDRHHRRPREDGERRSEDKERHRRTRDDEGRERKHRSHREREGEDGKSKRHRDSDVERKRSKDEQGDARKHRSHRDRDADKSKQRPSDKDSVTNTKSKPDVRKEQAKAVKPDKAPAEPKEGDTSPSPEEKVPGDIVVDSEEVSEESEKWRQRVAVAAESRERHSSQECVRASSSSMSGDILEDFSFSDDVDQIDNTAPDNASSEQVPTTSGGNDENLAKGSSEITSAVAEPIEPVVPFPAEEISPTKPPRPEEKLPEVKPEPSSLKKLIESENVKGKPIKLRCSKAMQPDQKGHTGSGSSVSSMKNNSPPKTDKRLSSCDSGRAPAPTKGHGSKKSLAKKVYSNTGSSVPHSPNRKDSLKRDHDSPTVSGHQHMSQHRGSVSLASQEKKLKNVTTPLVLAKAVTKPVMSPRRASMSDAVSKDKSVARDKKVPLKSSTKNVARDIHDEKVKHMRESRTGLTSTKAMVPTETPVIETVAASLSTHHTSHHKIGRRATVGTAELQSSTKPTGAELNRRTSVDVVKNVNLTAKLDVVIVPPLKKQDVKRTKENVAGSKEDWKLSKKQENAHNMNVDVTLKNGMMKNSENADLPGSKNATHKVNDGQEAEIKNETQQSIVSDVHKGKLEKKKHSVLLDTINVSISHPTSNQENVEQSKASAKPKNKEMISEKHKEKLEQNQASAKSKDKEMIYEKHKEKLEQDQASAKLKAMISEKHSEKLEQNQTPTRHQREDTPVPEPVPSICKSVRRDRQGSGSSSILARATSARTATPFDKGYTFIASPELKEHSSCETIPDDVSEGHNSLDLVRTLKKRKKKEELTKDDDEYNYEDEEFEDYDDDFEDDDEDEEASEKEEESSNAAPDDSRPNNEMDELLSALDRENERLLHSAKNRGTTDRNDSTAHPAQIETDKSPSNRRTFINFSSAKKSQTSGVAASKARRRGNDLLKMIELDVAHYELFDMPPVNEYELYMRTYGCSNTRQAYVQTNDDNIECETQTDEMEYSDKWCQHPPEDFNCTGGGEDTKESHEPERKPIDVVKLGKFLHKASQVITLLLEEEFSEISTRHGPIKNQSNIVLSESFVQLETSEITKDRHVAFSYFSPLQTKFLLTVYSKPHTIHQENRLSNSGLICVWNVGEPSQPEQVLVCESMPRCCCFSPGKATLVFAGMHDGSLVVWDLSEPSSLHRSHTIGDKEWLLRYPTYNTAGVLHDENHHSSVVQVTPIVATGDSAQASLNGVVGTGGGEGMSFQLATLEEQAIVSLWVVAEIMHPDPAGSESDLGLLPGGKVKLVKSSSIQLENPVRTPSLQTAMQALDLCLLPQNNSHFYVATDMGSIIHGVRYGGKAPPKAYHHQTEGLVRVTTLDFSPFCEPTFLAGCANGSLHLYTTESEYPLITWPDSTENSAPVVWVRWCRSRPSVFFVLDSNAFLYIWDLLMDDLMPLKQEKVAEARVTSFALSNDYSATGCGTPGRKPQMVMCLENGATEVHSISREFSAMMPDEINQFSQYLEKVV